MVEVAERVGGKGTHSFKFIQTQFDVENNSMFFEPRVQKMPPDSDRETDSVIKVTEALGLNVITGKLLRQGDCLELIGRLPGCHARDAVSSMLHMVKSINQDKTTPNWAGAAYSTSSLEHVMTNLDQARLRPMSSLYLRKVWEIDRTKEVIEFE